MSDSDKMFNFTRPPILLIGAGISKRYLEDYLDWSELMKSIAKKIGIDNSGYVAYLAGARDQNGKTDLPTVASELRKRLINGIKNEVLNPYTIYDKNEIEMYLGEIDPIKIFAASLCRCRSIKKDEWVSKELDSFRKLSGVVPCVITTNYDLFLETEIFTNFKVYSNVSDYYYSDSEGIGELYKIHGTATKPNTMILTREDYDELSKKSKIVTSKILSALCDYPMVILGYSMNDDDVKGIINDLISSLDEDKIQKVQENIVYVEYVEDGDGTIPKNKVFSFENKTMAISTIGTNNFKVVYDELGGLNPSMSPMAVRRARQMVKNVVLSKENSDNNNVAMIGVNRIDDMSPDKLVIAFADVESIRRINQTNLRLYTANQMMDDILNNHCRYSPIDVVIFFDTYDIFNETEYLPIFHFTREAEIGKDEFSSKMQSFYDKKKKQFDNRLEAIRNTKLIKTSNVQNVEDLRNILYNRPESFYRSEIIFYYYSTGLISENQAKELLKELQSKGIRKGENTAFRRAVTFLAFKSYEEEGCAGTRTSST